MICEKRISAKYGTAIYGYSKYGNLYTTSEIDDAYNNLLDFLNGNTTTSRYGEDLYGSAIYGQKYIEDPVTGRVGNFFIDSDSKLERNEQLPMGQLVLANVLTDRNSYGRFPHRNKQLTFHIYFYTYDGVKGRGNSSDLDNKKLVNYYIEEIGSAISSNNGEIKYLHNPSFGINDGVKYIPEKKIHWSVLPVTFSMKKC